MFFKEKSNVLDQNCGAKPKKKPKLWFQLNIGHALKTFCENSSINGIRYIHEPHRHWLERIWWISAIILSIYLCSSTIYGLKQKWDESPVIISYDAKLLPISTIPFPAITICPATRISAKKFNFTKTYRALFKLDNRDAPNVTKEDLQRLKVAATICNDLFSLNLLEYFHENVMYDSISDIVDEISTTFEETLVACRFQSKLSSCYPYFHDIFTEEGKCFTFNLMSPEQIFRTNFDGFDDVQAVSNRSARHWNCETGYEYQYRQPDADPFDEYPLRTFRTGSIAGLDVFLKILHENIDKLCDGALNGYRITFHTPYEFPYFTKLQYYISPKRAADFLITPKVMQPSPGLRTYGPNERQCYFPAERTLKFFKIYTQGNCQLECAWNVTLAKCGCFTLTMPRDNVHKLCGPAKSGCCVNASRDAHKKNTSELCNCLPECHSLSYDVSTLDAEYKLNDVFDKTRLNGSMDVAKATFNRIRVTFATDSYRPIYRTELYTLSDFLASCGGLFGLFIGASLLSFIEIIYYFTLHGFSMPNKRKNEIEMVTGQKRKKTKNKKNDKNIPRILLNDSKLQKPFQPFSYIP